MDFKLDIQYKALLELVKLGIGTCQETDFNFSELSEDMWERILEESLTQAIHLVCFNGIRTVRNQVNREVYNKWLSVATTSLANNERVLNAQNRLSEILINNNVPHIIIKGYASAYYYPDYNKRNFGDVDFLVDPDMLDETEKIIIDNGYTKKIDEHLFHRVYTKGRDGIEMHFEPAGIPEGSPGKLIRNYLEGAAYQYSLTDDPCFHNPKPHIHAIIILLHSLHHMMGTGLGIRHLCDWAMFVDKTCDDSFWDTDVLPLLRKTGLLKFTSIITKTSSVYLGTRCPDWASHINDDVCFAVISDIFSLGNFGKKNIDRAYSGYLISNHGKSGTKDNKIISLIKTMRDTMYSTYPILRKCIILYPFIFVWRIIKYLFLMVIGKRTSLLKLNSYADERRELYRQFELYENIE